jgi:hypothetical protein
MRQSVRNVIGAQAEATAYAHCVMNRSSFDVAVEEYIRGDPEPFIVQVREDAPEPLILTRNDLVDLMTVHFADWIQQLEPYDFWGYRRQAYANLATALHEPFFSARQEMMAKQPAKYVVCLGLVLSETVNCIARQL